jgi:tetratricopeptide (TPR) repeat protein
MVAGGLGLMLRQFALGLSLLAYCQSGVALGLGALQGNVWLGQPLDLRIPLQFDGKDAVNLSCFEAEVWHGETRKEPSRIRLTFDDAEALAGRGLLRIQSSHTVDEPLVVLNISVGCTGKVSRRYVVLPELQEASPSAALASAVVAAPFVQQLVPSAAVPVAKPQPPARVSATPKALVKPKPLNETSRLRLEANDALLERIAVLETQLKNQAGTPTYEEYIDKLKSELKALRDQSDQTASQMLELRAQLTTLQAQQWDPIWLYVLAGMCGLSWLGLIGLARQKAVQPWWRAPSAMPAPKKTSRSAIQTIQDAPEAALKGLFTAHPSTSPSMKANNAQTSTVTEVAGNAEQENIEAALLDAAPSPNMQAHLKAMNSEELFDIRQQADFYMSLGQHEQAIEVLKQRIEVDPLTSPMVYLDLFHTYHMLGLRNDYAELRTVFNRLFYGQVPEFAKYGYSGKELESYELLTRQICDRWTTPQAPDLLAQCIYRSDSRPATDFVDLPAFRDLMLLYEISSAGQLVEF